MTTRYEQDPPPVRSPGQKGGRFVSAIDTTPPATQAAILRAVAGQKFPKIALPTIASEYRMTLADLQTIINRHGYPNPGAMLTRADQLEATQASDDPDGIQGDESEAAAGQRLVSVPVDQLHPDPDNPRGELTGIEELADSLVQVGLLQPIVARRHQGKLHVVAGHRRLAAAKHLHWTHVDVIVRTHMRPDHVLAAMLIENGQRTDLDPIEEARGLSRLRHQLDCSELVLAEKVGRSLGYVNGRLLLLNLSAEDQAAIRAGDLGVTAGTQRARMNSGRVRPAAKGRPAVGHLSATHELAERVQARCTRAGHMKGKGKGVGGVGCGACWESVIRADEREHIHAISAKTGSCVICGALVEQGALV